MRGLWILILVVYYLCYCECELDSQSLQAQRLKASLLDNYTSTVPPSGIVQVNVTFAPIAIIALEEASQVFRFSAILVQQWTDPRLSWDIAPGLVSLGFETNEIWKPHVFIPNGVGDKISNIPASMPVRVFNDGQMGMFIITEFETICDIDVTWYPYDEQVCRLSLMTMFDAELSIDSQESALLFSAYFTGSSEWELLGSTISKKYLDDGLQRASNIDIEFRLRRHSIFYTLSIIFPMCLLSFLNSCVFLLPAASGEKISFLLSIFVSGAVFLNFINDAIPKSSNASRLTIYLVLLLSQSALALLATLFIMNVHHNQGQLLCVTRKQVKVTDSNAEADTVEKDHVTGKLDKFLFVLFCTMAAASILVFFV